MDDYTIEKLGPQHFKAMQSLFKHCFKRSLADDFFIRKFDTPNSATEIFGYVAIAKDGTLASSYGLYPCRISYEGKTYLAAISGDSMTHENHRGKKLFDTLARKTYQLAKDSGIKFMYCFPNQYTLTGSQKLSWIYREGEQMRTYRIKVSTIPLAKICRKNKMLNSIHRAWVNFILYSAKKDAAHFENSLLKDQIPSVIHDKDYFAYKSYSHNSLIRIADCNAWIKIDGELKIGDIENKNGINFQKLIRKLKRIAFWTGCPEIQTTVCEESHIHQSMKNDFPNDPSFLVGRMEFDLDFPKEKVKFTMADFDTF